MSSTPEGGPDKGAHQRGEEIPLIISAPNIASAPDEPSADTPARSTDLVGVRVDALTMQDTIALITEHVEAPGFSHHAGVNASKLVEASEHPRFRQVLGDADIVNADGMSVVWASHLLGTPLPERVTGIDTLPHLLRRAAQRGWPVYLLGAKEEVVAALASRLPRQYPGLIVAGYRGGYWGEDEESQVVADVARSRAKILLLGLPSPRKEFFVDQHQDDLGVGLAMGVGGSFDVMAGAISRAPRWMQHSGLEWAHRLAKEPRRLWRRYTIENAKFVVLVVRQAFAHRRRR